MTNDQSGASKRSVPIVPYLCLPEKEGEEAHLIGYRCRACGETYLANFKRVVCIKCFERDLETIALGRIGELFSFTIVHQSVPGVSVPYVAAVVSLPEGPFVRATLVGCEPKPGALQFGMKLEMVIEKVRVDALGNDIIAYQYRPA